MLGFTPKHPRVHLEVSLAHSVDEDNSVSRVDMKSKTLVQVAGSKVKEKSAGKKIKMTVVDM